MARGVTTEWEDIQVKLGNYLPREHEADGEEIAEANIERVEGYDPLEEKKLDELEEMEDDFDEDFLKEYKEKRLKELKEYAALHKFGTLMEINKQEFVQEVTKAPKGVYVVLHLYQNSIEECQLLNSILENLAKIHTLVKFLKIVANKCIESFPDHNCPAIVIYKDGTMTKQIIPAKETLGGIKMNKATVEFVLALNGVLKTEIEEDPRKKLVGTKFTKIRRHEDRDEDDSDEEDDRGYSNPKLFQ